ncbi:restriction endonuclease subunit S [Catenovulum agarivorans]|uniref:restriction endonuclease subunit S n=1 Tax=Catenovulum agarivorans TaxID=1172192 RepID=UPI00030D999A|nr:restriction endonuclease subunit S [Catenovulum agarivorans]
MAEQRHSRDGGNLMPEGWCEDNLGNLVLVERGSSPRPIKNFVTDKDGVNWVKIGDTKEGQKYVATTKEMITKEGALKSRFVGVGDFILSNSMSFGRPYIMAIEGYIHDGWFALRLPKGINSDYFYYLLSSSFVQDQFQLLAVGGVVKNISGDLVKKATLPLPPLAEQIIIADKLDTLLAQLENTKARLERIPQILKTFRQSVLATAVSGKLTEVFKAHEQLSSRSFRLKEVTAISGGKTPSKSNSNFWEGGDIPWVSPKDMKTDLIGSSQDKITEKAISLGGMKLIPPNSILVVTRSGILAHSFPVARTIAPVTINQDIKALVPNLALISPEYLFFLLKGLEQRVLDECSKAGTTVSSVETTELMNLKFDLPSLEEQTEIIRRVEELFAFADNIEQKANAALARVNNLTQSILAKAFRGELTAEWRAQNPELISGDNSAEALLAKIKTEREAVKKRSKNKTATRKKA